LIHRCGFAKGTLEVDWKDGNKMECEFDLLAAEMNKDFGEHDTVEAAVMTLISGVVLTDEHHKLQAGEHWKS
jgi:hypothetical protein